MRHIQISTGKSKKWWIFCQSLLALSVLWCVGAAVFWKAEMREQHLTYFETFFFCFVALLTIGFGDIYFKSNAGKTFFVVWSLIGIPVITIFISNLAEALPFLGQADITFGRWVRMLGSRLLRRVTDKHPRVRSWMKTKANTAAAEQSVRSGIPFLRPESSEEGQNAPQNNGQTLEILAELFSGEIADEHDTARGIVVAIRSVVRDMATAPDKRYTYEEWVYLTRLIRSNAALRPLSETGEEEDLVEWDWIGEDSPILSGKSEVEFALERLCESMARYVRQQRSLQNERGASVKNALRSMMGLEGPTRRRHSVPSAIIKLHPWYSIEI